MPLKEDVLLDPEFAKLWDSMQYAPEVFGVSFFPNVFYSAFGSFHIHLIDFFLKSTASITVAKIPRGFGKSTIITFLLAIWLIFIKGAKYILLISKTNDRAEELLEDVKNGLMHPSFVKVFGNVIGTKWSASQAHIYCPDWGVDAILSIKSIESHMRGTKKNIADRISYAIIDDPEDDGEVDNPKTLDKREKWVSKVLEPALAIKDSEGRPGKIWWLGTPIAKDCVVNRVAAYDDVALIEYPALVDTTAMSERLGIPVGQSIWEAHVTTVWLKDKRHALFSRGQHDVWWSEYMVDPKGQTSMSFSGEPHYFTEKGVEGKEIPLYMCIDAAYGLDRTNDSSAIEVGGYDSSSSIYMFESKSGRWGPKKFIKEVIDTLRYFNKTDRPIQKIGVESLAYNMYKYILKREIFEALGIYVSIVELKTKIKSKTNRIQVLIPYHQNGKLFIKKRMKVLAGQMGKFPSFKGGVDELDGAAYVPVIAKKPGKKKKDEEEKNEVSKHIDARMKKEDLRRKRELHARGRRRSMVSKGGLKNVV